MIEIEAEISMVFDQYIWNFLMIDELTMLKHVKVLYSLKNFIDFVCWLRQICNKARKVLLISELHLIKDSVDRENSSILLNKVIQQIVIFDLLLDLWVDLDT